LIVVCLALFNTAASPSEIVTFAAISYICRSMPLMTLRIILLSTFCWCLFAETSGQNPLTLRTAVRLAKDNNQTLKTAFYNIGIAETDIITAKLRPNPVINNQSLQSINAQNHPAGKDFFSPYNRQVWYQLTKPVRLPIQVKSKTELAQQLVVLEQKNYAELARNLSFDVANQWLDTWFVQTKLDLYIQAQKNIDSLVKINELRLKNLVITQTDLIRTQLVAEQYHLQIRSMRQAYLNELKKLRLLLNSNDSISIDVKDALEPLPASSFIVDSIISVSQSNRTDALVAKSQLTISTSNITYQKAMAIPVPELGIIYNPQNSIPYLGFYGTIQLPFFNKNQGEIAKAQLEKSQAEQGLVALQQRIYTEIDIAHKSYQVQRDNLKKYERILSQSEVVLNSVRYAYLKGGTTIIDFLEAQRTWFDTRQIYFDALLSYRKSYIQLLYATGIITQLYE
jgi:cobalt-zinc-cadmium efflux system outer membrane protein